MAVVPLTLAISLGLVAGFVIFFLRQHARGRLSDADRDSVLPFADETPRAVPTHEHDDDDDGCGCRDGRRAPCAGCLKQRREPTA
ncbi:MAG: hypothetical protein JNL39_21710 [Opitutaceae bacterium]|nr:hypothetical protein [Opitutaceae bacterium]